MGIWKLYGEAVDVALQEDSAKALTNLGVCSHHFNTDQNQLHRRGSKHNTQIEKSWIYYRRCLFCHRDKYFFSRDKQCKYHSVKISECNIHVPCAGMKACSGFAESHLVEPGDKSKARYICSECFQEHGGHFFIRNGRGKELFTCSDLHSEDDKKSLKLISRWVQEISEFGDPQSQKTLVYELSNVLIKYFEEKSSIFQQHEQDSKEHENIECRDEKKNISYLSLCTLFRLKKVQVKNFCDKSWSAGFIKKHSYWCREALGQALWTSRSEVKSKICDLEKPQNLEQYRDAFPVVIREFFEGFLGHVQKKNGKSSKKNGTKGIFQGRNMIHLVH